VIRVAKLCEEHGLYLIEDCCDAFGAKVGGRGVGTFGDAATLSFYPAHHITMGEGGAVLTNSGNLIRIIESFRDWGRDCFCKPGKSDTCGRRFDWQFAGLPKGYDHKYTYSHIGYNLKISDMQAAVGLSQLSKLDHFVKRRRENFTELKNALGEVGLSEYFHLPVATPGTEPSWFGLLLCIRDGVPIDRTQLVRRLEARGVGTRLLFGGNLTRQPAFQDVPFRVSGSLTVTDKLMNDAFWIGVWPGIDSPRIAHMIESIREACRELLSAKPV
jgi:CDP-6-deoxy-D-xylo-4-hexulose-3-dehydrase